jgi:hypothetical protein
MVDRQANFHPVFSKLPGGYVNFEVRKAIKNRRLEVSGHQQNKPGFVRELYR